MSGIFIRKHAQCAARNVNVTVISTCSTQSLPLYSFEITRQTIHLVDEIVVYYPKCSFSIIRPFVQPLLFLIAFIKAYKLYHKKPDLIHVNILARYGLLAFFLHLFYQIPYIITEHSSRYLPQRKAFRGTIKKMIVRYIVKRAKAVTVVSQTLKEAMLFHKIRNSNFQILYNVVDTGLFVPVLNPSESIKKKIVCITNFKDSEKNTTGIIKAVKQLSLLRNDFEFHFIGMNEGNDTGFEEMAADMNMINKFLFFDGLMQEQELVNALNHAAFLVSFSNYETFLVVVPEAWACGVPVISTKVGILEQHYKPERGLITDIGNIEQLTHHMNWMLDNYNSFNKSEMRQYVIEHFSEKIISVQLKDIYQQSLY